MLTAWEALEVVMFANAGVVSEMDSGSGLLDWLFGGLLPRQKVLDALRRQWARPGDKREPFSDRWFRLTRADRPVVDDKTWEDLELLRVVRDLDTTVTPLGSQVLHGQLREYIDDASALRERHEIHLQLRDDAGFRERVQLALQPLRDPQHAHIVDSLFGDSPDAPAKRALLTLWGIACLIVLVCVASSILPIWIMVVMIVSNVVVVYRHSRQTSRQTEMLGGCLTMLSVAEKLSKIPPGNALTRELRDEAVSRSSVKRGLWPMLAYQWTRHGLR